MDSVIITGSMGCLGTEISEYLRSKDYKVIDCDLQLGHDLTDETFVQNFFHNNPANYLVNLYALNPHVDADATINLFDISLDSVDEYLKVNLTSLFSVCREFARNNENGSIVNFSASTGIVSARPDLYDGGHKHIAYSISKAGVDNMTKFLATHLAPKIRVNCIAPGGVEANQDEEFIKKYSKHTPLNRMMKKDELNGIIEFLCSSQSSYVTGATFVIDGGWTIW